MEMCLSNSQVEWGEWNTGDKECLKMSLYHVYRAFLATRVLRLSWFGNVFPIHQFFALIKILLSHQRPQHLRSHREPIRSWMMTVCCDQRPQHLRSHREATRGWRMTVCCDQRPQHLRSHREATRGWKMTVCCDQRPQHLRSHKESTHGWRMTVCCDQMPQHL